MNFNELVSLFFERSNALQSYWTIYVVVIGGLLAFSSLRQQKDFVTTALITVLFAFFAFKNLGAIHDVTMQRIAVATAIKNSDKGAPEEKSARDLIIPTLATPDYDGIRTFHITTDVLTIAALWAMELRRRRQT